MTDEEKLKAYDVLVNKLDVLDYVYEIQFDYELEEDDSTVLNKLMKEHGYRTFGED